MNKIAEKLLKMLLKFELILPDKKDNYLYGIEMLLMKILSIFVIGIIAIITKKYVETIVFYFTFKSLRSYTNGYHSKHYWVCLIESAIVYICICLLISPLVMKYLIHSYFVTVVAMFFIFLLSPVNSESIMLDDDEIQNHKEIIKYILIIHCVFLFVFINYRVKLDIVAFFELAIILDAVLIIIARIMNVIKHTKTRSGY